MKLTKKLLLQLETCSSGIEFCERNKLFGFPSERLSEICGDYDGFFRWLKYKTNIEFDQNGNLVRWEYSSGYWVKYEYDQNNNKIQWEHSEDIWMKYESEFYDNGQLKRIGGLVIPYFEQEI